MIQQQTQEPDEPRSQEALCPRCGQGFQTFRPRPRFNPNTPALLAPAVCPRCGCRDCIVK
ncbi:MAG: hypothetical protein V1797_05425 [Pseudomonadota bacterium]